MTGLLWYGRLIGINKHERKLPSSSYKHNTLTTLKTSANALQSCSKSFHALNASMQVIPHRCFEGCQCIVVMDELGSCL